MVCLEKLKKGSMTVEAAFVVPIVLIVIFLMISVMMFVHNRSWYTAAAGEALITASTQGIHRDIAAGDIAVKKMSERIQKQGFPAGKVSAKAFCKGDQVKIQIVIRTISIPLLHRWETTIERETMLIRPVIWIRKIQAYEAWKGETDGS